MKGARSVAFAAALGNLLQGWDNAAVAGALLYLKVEFNLDENPTLEGLVVAATLIGAVASTGFAGPTADSFGRKSMLCVSGVLFALSAGIMVWSPTIYVLIFGRFLVGMGIGLAATVVPILISESAPTEIRGQLATLPQLLGAVGLFVAYCMVFGLSLLADPSWRMILGVLLLPSILYLALCIFFLPESPRWLVSKGRMLEARAVLQGLRNQEDVSGELALLVEGLGVGVDTSLEEWLVKPAEMSDILGPTHVDDGRITLFGPGGPDEDLAWVAQPFREESSMNLLSRRDSGDAHNLSIVDNMVSLFGSLQPVAAPEDLEVEDHEHKNVILEDEEAGIDGNGYMSTGYNSEEPEDAGIVGDFDDLSSPLLRKRTASKTNLLPRRNSSSFSLRGSIRDMSRSSSRAVDGMFGETVGSVGIGGGWQLAWRTDGEGGRYERVFMLQENADASRFTSHMSLPGVGPGGGFGTDSEAYPAVALIGPSVQFNKDLDLGNAVGPATVHPAETATRGPAWSELLEPGVKRALVVGVGIEFLQQFCGINAVLFYTPQILQQSGADVMAASVGLSSNSASILASSATCLMMIPCIVVAMWLMDRAGRRQLLLTTIPVLALALVAVILVGSLNLQGVVGAAGSFLGVSLFICSFVMGFGPIPNILCSEIFPTRVRGIAIGITSATMWICNVIVSYAFPVANARFGLNGVFSFFAVMSALSWVFVFIKVPETKGLPLEIICEFFAMAGQNADTRKHHHADADGTPAKLV